MLRREKEKPRGKQDLQGAREEEKVTTWRSQKMGLNMARRTGAVDMGCRAAGAGVGLRRREHLQDPLGRGLTGPVGSKGKASGQG